LAKHHSFETLQWAGVYAYAPPGYKPRAWLGPAKLKSGMQTFNFLFRHRHQDAVGGHDVDDTGNLQHAQALSGRDMNKQIAGENGHLYFCLAFLPVVNRVIAGQKRLHRPADQLPGDSFLVPGNHVGRVPVGFERLLEQRALAPREGRRYVHNRLFYFRGSLFYEA
jgi:hypothetical protein